MLEPTHGSGRPETMAIRLLMDRQAGLDLED